MDSRTTGALRELEPRLARQLAERAPTSSSMVGMAEILENAAAEVEASATPESDPHELELLAVFLGGVIEHTNELLHLDRLRSASEHLSAVAARVDRWFRDARRARVRKGMRVVSWESLQRAAGVVAIGGDAVADGHRADRG
jgi:hypothetical protein